MINAFRRWFSVKWWVNLWEGGCFPIQMKKCTKVFLGTDDSAWLENLVEIPFMYVSRSGYHHLKLKSGNFFGLLKPFRKVNWFRNWFQEPFATLLIYSILISRKMLPTLKQLKTVPIDFGHFTSHTRKCLRKG